MSMSDKIWEILGNLFMVEDAARLDYIKDKIAKRTEEMICYAECEKSIQICVRSHKLVAKQELKAFGRVFCSLPLIYIIVNRLLIAKYSNDKKVL